jgi:hypothetical protein
MSGGLAFCGIHVATYDLMLLSMLDIADNRTPLPNTGENNVTSALACLHSP